MIQYQEYLNTLQSVLRVANPVHHIQFRNSTTITSAAELKKAPKAEATKK